MPKLKDFMNEKGEFYEAPPYIVQLIEPADYVSDQIMEHMRYGYQLSSLTPISTGPHGGRVLLLFHKTQA